MRLDLSAVGQPPICAGIHLPVVVGMNKRLSSGGLSHQRSKAPKLAPIKTAMIDFKRHLSSSSKSDSSNTYATVRLKRRHHQPWGGSRRYAISSIHILSEKHLGHNIACMVTSYTAASARTY